MPDIWMDVDTALAEVPVNLMPLLDDTDFKSRETAVAYNAAGMDLVWNFVTPAGAMSQTAVTPTTGGTYDWAHQGDGMYSIEIPASGGASINNDTEGFGWFTGIATGVLPWRGPVIGFRASGLNDALVESAYSTTRGLAGTALPNAAAEAAGGLYTRGTGAGQINQDANGRVNVNVTAYGGSAGTFSGGRPEVNTTHIAGSAVSTSSAQIGVNVVNAGGTAWGSGAITAASIATDAITAAKIAADAIGASELAADAVAEIQSGLATASALATVAGYIDTEVADIQSRLPAALTANGNMKSDMLRLNGDATAAALLALAAPGIVSSTCSTGSTTTSIVTNLTEATDDHYNGAVIAFTGGALAGQRTSISDYNGTTKTLTVVALTEAPANTDPFVIV